MTDVCGSCGRIGYLPDGVICDECEATYWTGPEEASFIVGNIMSRQNPLPMSDPWDMVKP